MQLPIGTTVNALAIVAGGAIGSVIGSRLPERIKLALYQALSLAIIAMGAKLIIGYQNIFLLTLSLVLGAVTGSLIGLQERLEGFADYVQRRMTARLEKSRKSRETDADFSVAFISSTAVFCVGSMAVLGPVEEGLSGNYQILLVKAFMDGVIAVNIASSKGKGVMLSALPLFVYQGGLTLLATLLQPLLQGEVLIEFSAVGGVLIAGVGASLLFPDKFKMLNLLPAMLWVCVLFPLFH